ncbi:universal stress protein (plasmid) [Streptomyces sp. BHT-5-2]|uniref:universal stress protein n=1 Tax=unclassified Streptomyces TaxID=2593676 RepID=UPI001C8E5711|nr:universal stress protein [Streptomyces sp. BHT-5-2]QZL08887.1 universal stress protein [Streptomyces sp. BHT-5-2]
MSGEPTGAGRIVVGVDGSDSSKEALRWAVHQAELTDSTVHVVTAWEYPPLYGSIGWIDAPQELAADAKGSAGRALDHAVEETVPAERRDRIHRCLAYGTPTAVLLDQARGADLLVVGSHGHGGFTGALLGSVGQHCTQHAPCPVVVVRGTSGGT